MEHLIEDAKAAGEYLVTNRDDLAATTFYTKGSIAVFPHVDIKNIGEVCTTILNTSTILTPKEEYEPGQFETEAVWKRYDKNTAIMTLSPCTFKCVGHSEARRKDWLAISDFTFLDKEDQEGVLEFEFPPNQGIIISASMPWKLLEGRVKTYILSEKPKTDLSSTKKPSPMKTFEDCAAKHAELKERVAKLDQRVWADQGPNAKTVKQYEETLNAESDKKDIKKYAKCLATLEERVASAEKDTTLPGLLASLEEVRDYLDDPEKLKGVPSRSLESRRKKFDELIKTEQNLVGKAKAIADLLIDVKALSEKAGTPKLSAPKKKEVEVVVPEIDEGTLTPHIIDHADGPDGFKAVVTSFRDDGASFTIMVQALKNPQLTALHQKWTEERQKVNAQCAKAMRDPSETVDVTLFLAYGNALRQVFKETKANTETKPTSSVSSYVTAKPKKINCSECHKTRNAFDDTNLCRECWTEIKLEPRIEGLDERAGYLNRQSTKETSERQKRNKAIRRKNAEIRASNASKKEGEEKEKEALEEGPGPLETLYDQYCTLNEKLVKAADAFRVPNSSAAAWEKLKVLLDKADAMLPKRDGDGTRNAGDDDNDEENYSDDADDIVAYSDEEEEEEEEEEDEYSSEPKRKRKTHRSSDEDEESGDGSLAHQALKTLRLIPVHSVHKGIIDAYASVDRHPWLEEELKRLEDIKEVHGFTVQEVYPDEGDEGEPEEWHTHFLTRAEAAKQANETRVPGKIKTKVFTKRIRPEEEKEEEEKEKSKKNKKDEEEDE